MRTARRTGENSLGHPDLTDRPGDKKFVGSCILSNLHNHPLEDALMEYQIGKDIQSIIDRLDRLEVRLACSHSRQPQRERISRFSISELPSTLGNNPALPGWVAIHVESGGTPQPVGSSGTMVVENTTSEPVTITSPGQVAIQIPPAQKASIQKIDGARGINIETVQWDYYDPCYPAAPVGVLCIIQEYRTVIQPRTEYYGQGDATPDGTTFKFGTDRRLH